MDFKEQAGPSSPGTPPGQIGLGNYFVKQVVGVTGFEPVTLRLSSACSNQLSYTPARRCARRMVELRRLELLTYSLQSYRSTN